MRQYLLRETMFTHFSVAFGVLLISAVLIVTTQGRVFSAALPSAIQTTAELESAPAAVQSDITGPELHREGSSISSRGGREGVGVAVSPTPAVLTASPISSEIASTPAPSQPTSIATVAPMATAVLPSLTSVPTTDLTLTAEAVLSSPTTAPTAAPTLAAVPTTIPVTSPTQRAAPTAVAAPTPSPTMAPTPAQSAPDPPPATPAPNVLSQLRVGIQAGHWKEAELPAELAGLRGATGASENGWREVDVNIAVANTVAGLLRDSGVQVDVLPATVPVAYKADAFVAIHGDANGNTSVSGYKLARARWSKIPQKDDALIQAVSSEYETATGLKEHNSSITENMRQYYGFDWPDLQHATAPTTPSAILELGFLTTQGDRKVLLEQQDKVASGIAKGIVRFLTGK